MAISSGEAKVMAAIVHALAAIPVVQSYVQEARESERFLAPGIPLHRILRMLPKIGAGFCDEPVRKTVFWR